MNVKALSCECRNRSGFDFCKVAGRKGQPASQVSHAKGTSGGDTRATSSMLAAARTQWERAKAFVPSDEQIRQRIAEREKQAGEHGHVPKTQ